MKKESYNLVTTGKFMDIECNFYEKDGEIYLTREQIGRALDYSNPRKAIEKLHLRHKERLDKYSIKVIDNKGNIPSTQIEWIGSENLNKGISVTTFYSKKGIMEICRHSHKPKANNFIDFCWDVIEEYYSLNKEYLARLDEVEERLNDMEDVQTKLLSNQKKGGWSKWMSKVMPIFNLMTDHFDISLGELYHNLFLELENIFPETHLNQLKEDYCIANNLVTCYTMEVIEAKEDLRMKMEYIITGILGRHELEYSENTKKKMETIFD